ncbi:ESPR-type extended signal peptide-containing protein [uncultured Veillonella sp.]|uniref:ESPR-type extended signal peptide-containing protein n=1 Tax=uncultured Veillonella sp. TaxID=159268 RepID=UPI002623B61F|nr:ESPR-type extended signal peptide-containing protein [uncultured Veillonella sp.]
MNRHYKVIWSKVKNTYVVVSELAKRNSKSASTKSQSGQRIGVALSVLALCAGLSGVTQAATMNGNAMIAEVTGAGSSISTGSASQGATATIYGPMNVIDAQHKNFDGVANSIVGVANATKNSNASLIFGAGNTVENSYGNVTLNPFEAAPLLDKPAELAKLLASKVADSGGQILVIGGANTVDNARFSSVTGVSNKLIGSTTDTTEAGSSSYNFISGAKNTVTESDNTYLIGTNNAVSSATGNALVGDYRSITGGANNVILGSGKAGNVLDTTVSNAVVAGYNANASVADGVAIGSNSVASVAAGVAGAAPTNTTVSDDDKKNATWTSTLGAVSVGYAESKDEQGNIVPAGTRQITNVAAGTQDTDAVNLAQLNKVADLINISSTGSGVEYVSINSTADGNKDNLGASADNAIAIGPDASTAAEDSLVIGSSTIEKTGKSSRVIGNGNMLTSTDSYTVEDNKVFGDNNKITNSNRQLVFGDNNTISKRDEGTNNGIPRTTVSDIVIGKGNQIGGNDTFRKPYNTVKVIGNNNKVPVARDTIVLGDNQNISNGVSSIIIGSLTPADVENGVENWSVANIAIGYGAINGKGAGQSIAIGTRAKTGENNQLVIGNSSSFGNGTGTFGSIYGHQNKVIESDNSSEVTWTSVDGANTHISGSYNLVKSASSALIYGSGNQVTNSEGNSVVLSNDGTPINGDDLAGRIFVGLQVYSGDVDEGDPEPVSFDKAVSFMKSYVKAAGGDTTVVGSGNITDYTGRSQLLGNGNVLKGAEDKYSVNNTVSGFANTGENLNYSTIIGTSNTVKNGEDNVVLGDYHTVEGGNHNIIIGSRSFVEKETELDLGLDPEFLGFDSTYKVTERVAEKPHTKDISNAVMLGYNTDVTINGGVALGSESIAATDSSVQGYNPTVVASTATTPTTRAAADATTDAGALDSATWKSTLGAVSVGYAAEGDTPAGTRQITNVAAGTDATDAVNVAQLKAAKVTVTGGTNIESVESTATLDGGTVYKINTIDKDTTVARGAVTYTTDGKGTLTLTDSNGENIAITGLQDTYVTAAKLENGTLTLTRNAGEALTVTDIATKTDLAAIKPIEYFSVNSTETGNKNNLGASGTNAIAIGPKVSASGEGSIAIGFNNSMAGAGGVVIGRNTRTSGDSTVIIGDGAGVDPNIALDGHIAIGKNARVFAGGGEQEAKLGFDPDNWPKGGAGGYDNPTDRSRVATGIAMGVNAKGRTGSIDIGGRTYNGLMGGKQVAGNDAIGFHVNQTALGTNTYAKGLFSTMLGSYSIATGSFDGSGRKNTMAYGAQNFGATVLGSLNSIRSNETITEFFGVPLGASAQGVANTITGVANITDNTNGSLVYGAGNKISNSITPINPPTSGAKSVDAMVDTLQKTIRSSKSGGATMAFGGGNVADYTQRTAIIGVNNTVTGTSSDISQHNAITGFENTAKNVDFVTATGSNNTIETSSKLISMGNDNAISETDGTILMGDNRTVAGSDNSIILGTANKTANPTLRAAADTTLTTTAQNVVVMGYNANAEVNDGVALGSNSIANIDKGVEGYVPSGATNINKATPTWTSTLGSVSVGTPVAGAAATATRQITGVAAGTQDTDAVSVAQLKAAKVSVAQGTNVTVTPSTAEDGSTIYTVAATDTDTKIASGNVTYDGSNGTLTLTDTNNGKVEITGLKDRYITSGNITNNTLTLNLNEGNPIVIDNIATIGDVNNSKIHYYSVNGPENPANNYYNDGATGNNALAAGVSARADAHNSVAVGNNATIKDSNGGKGSGDIAIGNAAKIDNYADQSAGISIGQNVFVENMAGQQEAIFALGQTTFSGGAFSTARIPTDPSKVAAGIAIGENSYARSGSLMVGTHKYIGEIGDVTVNTTTEAGRKATGVGVNATTIGTNSFNNGSFSTITGAYSIASGNYAGGRNTVDAGKNFGATIVGSLNSIESATGDSSSGLATGIVGFANKTANSSGALIFGAGNEITNSITSTIIPGTIPILGPSINANSAKALQEQMKEYVKDVNSGGATLAIGGGNKADYTHASSIIGVNNTLTGTARDISQYNSIMGYNNQAENVSDVTVAGINNKITGTKTAVVLGDNHTVTGANNSIVIGSADAQTELTATDATVIGHNGNVEKAGGVALGSESVATVDKGVLGYIPTGKNVSDADKAGATWTSKLAAVSVGDAVKGLTRQITNVAAGTQDTDAVNVAQLQAVAEAVTNTAAGGHTEITLNGKTLTKDNPTATDNNLTLAVTTDTNGKNIYDIKLSDKLVIGTPGKDGENGQPGNITIIGTPGVNGEDGQPGKDTSANISVKDGVNGLDGKDGVTRIVYTDEDNKEHEVATMDDGLKFAGDDGNTKVVAKKLNEQLDIKGGAKDFTEDNIAVVADVDAEGNATGLHVKLAKNINLADGSIKFNETAKDDKGNSLVKGEDGKWYIDLTGAVYDKDSNTYTKDGNPVDSVTPKTTGTVELSENGLDNGGNTITNVGDGVKDSDAVNKGQLDKAIETVTNTVSGDHTAITLNGQAVTPGENKLGDYEKDHGLEIAAKTVDGKTTYDIKMGKDLVVGTETKPGKPGENGEPDTPDTPGEAGSIIIIGTPGVNGEDGQPGKDTSATIKVRDGKDGLNGKDGKDGSNGTTRIIYTDEGSDVEHEVATMDDGLKFGGDAGDVFGVKLNNQVNVKGGITATDLLSDNNIGVVADNGTLNVKLAKNLTGLTSANIGGIIINNGGINMGDKKITNVGSGIVEGDNTNNTNVANISDVIQLVGEKVEASKVTAGDNIKVEGNKVSLKDDITLGKDAAKQVEIKGSDSTITAGSGVNKVALDGKDASVKAGEGANQVALDGKNGQVTIGKEGSQIIMGNQEVTAEKFDGTKMAKSENGQFITGLDNTTWDPETNGYVPDRAATEGQLKGLAEQISNIDTAVKDSSRVFAGDEGADKKVTVKNGEILHLNGGADVKNLSDGNIGVVTHKDDKGNPTNGLDIKLSKDLTGLNSVTTGNTTINNNGLTVKGNDGKDGATITSDGLAIKGEDGKDKVVVTGDKVDMGGNRVQGVGDAKDATDAVNKGQLDNALNAVGNGMGQMSNRISKLDRRVDRVGAGAAALAALHPLEFSPEAKWEVSAGVGNYRGANAVALGAFYRPNGDTMFSIGTSLGGGENMINAGVTLRVGDGETENYPARKVMAQQIKDLQTVVDSQNAKIEELTQLVNTLVQNSAK